MSLAIQVDDVAAVLLADGEWHEVEPGSFDLDAYEYMQADRPLVLGGQVTGVPSTGARWMVPRQYQEAGSLICCPLTAILGIRIDK